jgi:hypothetical protein
VILNASWYEDLTAAEVREIARRSDCRLGAEEARARAARLRWLVTALDLENRTRAVRPRTAMLDDLDRVLVEEVRKKTRVRIREMVAGTPFRGAAEMPTWPEVWQYFFHMFSDPLSRMGPGLNYADCMRSSHAYVLPSGWTVFDCRPRRDPPLVPAGATEDEPSGATEASGARDQDRGQEESSCSPTRSARRLRSG